MLVGGGTSIMPRVAPALYEFVELDNGDYLKIAEAVFRIFDRQDWLRVNRARARIKVFVDKFGIDELRRQVEEELEGDWVAERDFSVEHRLFVDDERESAPAPPQSYGSPQRRRPRVRALPRGQRRARRSRTASSRSRSRSRAATSPPSSSAASRRSCATTPAATRARPCSRTCCCAGCATRACTTCGARSASSGSADAGTREIADVVSCPGTDSCKLGITSSMGLNQAVQERVAGDGHHRPADARDPHQDERLPERLRPAPRRRHRLLRRVDQSRRAHDPGVHPARRRRLRRRAGRRSARG